LLVKGSASMNTSACEHSARQMPLLGIPPNWRGMALPQPADAEPKPTTTSSLRSRRPSSLVTRALTISENSLAFMMRTWKPARRWARAP
jgi:hypothetical protein